MFHNHFKADLHCHSSCSDGTLTPKELIDLAADVGLKGLAITDHDTIDAYKSIVDYSKQKGIEIISGVEFSCVHRKKSIHILGYSFSLQNKPLAAYCEQHKERRIQRYRKILNLLSKSRMPLTEEEILDITQAASIGRPHIAMAMVKKGFVSTIEEAFKRFLGEGKPCYVKGDAFPVQETINIIHNAGGLAVIAHPHLIKNAIIVRELLEMNFDGIECFYSRFDKASNSHWVEIAKQKKWLITGGSDFHGSVKRHIQLGCSWVDEGTFHHLKQVYLSA